MGCDAGTEMIYLDNAATTAVLPEVRRAMEQTLDGPRFGNPSSRHRLGLLAEKRLREARLALAGQAGVGPGQLALTSGGTEANALALLGAGPRPGGHLLVSAVEHPSVLGSARQLSQTRGVELELLPVGPGGRVDPAGVRARLRPETAMVAVMLVNNETGVIQPAAEIAALLRRHAPRCRLLVDAVQAFGLLSTDLDRLGAHLLSASAHKLHGPKGVGCLAWAAGCQPAPLWGGGDQEGGARPGTENVPGAVGFARALALSQERDPAGRLRELCLLLQEAVQRRFPGAYPLGDQAHRAPQMVAVAVPGVPSEVLVNLLEAGGVCASSGAACHSRRSLRSHVLEAMGVSRDHGVLRLSLSHTTTREQVARAVEVIEELKT
jgi:cysteine desulfurase